jgi:transposase
MYYYTGIDVSKQSLKVFDGIKEYEVPNERGLKTFKKLIKKNYGKEWNEAELIYESTGSYSNYLREFASKNKLRVYEMNPKKSANFAKALGNRSKTDSIDAKMLYRFHLLLKEEDLNIPEIDEATEQLGSYIVSYEIIQKARIMLSNHLYSKEYVQGVDSKLKESIKKEAKHLTQIEETLEKEMKAFAENNSKIREDFSNLLSIKGIGVISAINLLYLFRKYPNANRNEITALAGLDPVKRQSGSSLNGGRKISKAGNSLLRKILYLSCMNSIQHNDRIRVFYEHLITNHKKPKVALIACMRKILLIAHQIYANKSEYKPLYIDDKNICPSS